MSGWQEIDNLRDMLAEQMPFCSCAYHMSDQSDGTLRHLCRAQNLEICPCSAFSGGGTQNRLTLRHRNNYVELTESAEDASLTKVYVTGLDNGGITLKLDLFGIHFFKKRTLNKICDYLILTRRGDDALAVFVDLKSTVTSVVDDKLPLTTDKDLERVWQFNGGSLLFDYLMLALKYHTEKGLCLSVKRHFVELYQDIVPAANVSKTAVDPSILRKLRHKDIKAVRVYNKQSVQFKDLLS